MYALVDVDDTVADLMEVWLRRYNRKYKDNLKEEQITDWDMTKFVKPECGKKIYDFIESPHLYNYIKPMPRALDGVNALRDLGFEIIYATHSTRGAAGRKYDWLFEHGFWNSKDHYFEGKDKYLLKGILMIDDGFHNFEKFDGYGLLIDMPWNRKFEYKNRVHGWEEILDNINKYKEEIGI